MANDYKVSVKISVTKDPGDTLINSEETTFADLSFQKMTQASAEHYKLLAKIAKAIK